MPVIGDLIFHDGGNSIVKYSSQVSIKIRSCCFNIYCSLSSCNDIHISNSSSSNNSISSSKTESCGKNEYHNWSELPLSNVLLFCDGFCLLFNRLFISLTVTPNIFIIIYSCGVCPLGEEKCSLAWYFFDLYFWPLHINLMVN